MDRNDVPEVINEEAQIVALLAEGVDRNSKEMMPYDQPKVALLAEGVDRNIARCSRSIVAPRSPSSRRAWIEIKRSAAAYVFWGSPSSRRAWIEITFSGKRVDF